MELELIKVNLTLLPPEEGGRKTPITNDGYNGRYRPHLVVGDKKQREAVIIEKDGFKNYIDEKYLGIAFWSGPDTKILPVNSPIEMVFALIYAPHEQYDKIKEGIEFTIREGPRVIGFGDVLNRWRERNA